MIMKINYIYLKDLPRISTLGRYDKVVCTTFLKDLLDLASLSSKQIPSDLTDSATIYNELISLVLGKFYDHPFARAVLPYDGTLSTDDLNGYGEVFAYHLILLLNDTHERYVTILNEYASAKSHLMDKVKSETASSRKYNDTPQNSNALEPYQGDDYISNFTKFETENSTDMGTKMARLKEVEDGYSNVMAEWVEEFHRIFMEENA